MSKPSNLFARMTARKILVMILYMTIQNNAVCEKHLRSFDSTLFSNQHAIDAMVAYAMANFFDDGDARSVDIVYIQTCLAGYDTYIDRIIASVNKNTRSFPFEQMDYIDQALLTATGLETLCIKTDKKVILNEMIEIAKRYGDEGTKKLINALGNAMVDEFTITV